MKQLKAEFAALAERTFKHNRGGALSRFDPLEVIPIVFMAVKAWDSKYKTKPLRESLVHLFGEKMPIFAAAIQTKEQRMVRVAVTSTTDGHACVFSNYNRLVSTGQSSHPEQCDQPVC